MRHIAPVLSLTLAVSFTNFSPGQTPYTERTLRTAVHAAHTADDYAQLAHYYTERALLYVTLSEDQERVLGREAEHPSIPSKFPTAADKARRMREYYVEQSSRCRELSRKYASLERAAFRAPEMKETATR